jgi:hypothetical protein
MSNLEENTRKFESTRWGGTASPLLPSLGSEELVRLVRAAIPEADNEKLRGLKKSLEKILGQFSEAPGVVLERQKVVDSLPAPDIAEVLRELCRARHDSPTKAVEKDLFDRLKHAQSTVATFLTQHGVTTEDRWLEASIVRFKCGGNLREFLSESQELAIRHFGKPVFDHRQLKRWLKNPRFGDREIGEVGIEAFSRRDNRIEAPGAMSVPVYLLAAAYSAYFLARGEKLFSTRCTAANGSLSVTKGGLRESTLWDRISRSKHYREAALLAS